ncbi:MAG: LysM peptidoglycan-binding domain-containing protein [Bacilli bacterium]|nr:LysM peptidoglycan-binding domain-containing protein [Bacilli bacterium]
MDDIRKLTGIIIDPGHGGTDSGATGNDMLEKDYTLLISEYMYDRFKELGVPVALTRNSDITLSPTERTSKILSEFGNNKDVIVISNHLNAGGGTGAEVIYALRNKDTLAKKILESLGAEGQTTRKYYQRRLPSDTSKDYYFIHRNTGVTEPLIVEYGFIDDKPENVEFLNENYQRLAEAVIRSVMDYKGLKYIPPEGYISNTYVVQKGDSLYSIARKLNTTVDELKRLNNLTSNTLSIGQVLKIPSPTSESETYTVKKGDSLYSIAQEFNTTVDILKKLNNLTSNTLSIGQILKLPKPTDIDEPSQEPTNITYTVQSGDSLYKIATKYNTTIDAIKKANNLTNDLLSIGQVLTIPTTIISEEVPEPNYFNYKVVSGDSLYKIAKKYNVTVDSIKELNNLTSNLLSIGQTIKIPTTSTNERTYIVKSGDSLYSIAKEFNTTVDNLKKLNNLSSNMLSIGQILIIE